MLRIGGKLPQHIANAVLCAIILLMFTFPEEKKYFALIAQIPKT